MNLGDQKAEHWHDVGVSLLHVRGRISGLEFCSILEKVNNLCRAGWKWRPTWLPGTKEEVEFKRENLEFTCTVLLVEERSSLARWTSTST